MKRLIMITEQLSKITVSKLAAVRRVTHRLAFALLIALAAIAVSYPTVAYAASSSVPEMIPSMGDDFWFTFMNNKDVGSPDLHIFVIPEADTKVYVKSQDGTSINVSADVDAGKLYHYEIPVTSVAYSTESGGTSGKSKGVHVYNVDKVPMSVYVSNTYKMDQVTSMDMTPVIATKSLGTEYVVQTYTRDKKSTELVVVGTEADTKVTINLKVAAKNHAAGEFDVTLGAGETYQLNSVTNLLQYSWVARTPLYPEPVEHSTVTI